MTQNIQEKILKELENPGFPDLQFLYSDEVISAAPAVLQSLLDQEILDFENTLKIQDTDINFDTFQDMSILSYFYSLLSHWETLALLAEL